MRVADLHGGNCVRRIVFFWGGLCLNCKPPSKQPPKKHSSRLLIPVLLALFLAYYLITCTVPTFVWISHDVIPSGGSVRYTVGSSKQPHFSNLKVRRPNIIKHRCYCESSMICAPKKYNNNQKHIMITRYILSYERHGIWCKLDLLHLCFFQTRQDPGITRRTSVAT